MQSIVNTVLFTEAKLSCVSRFKVSVVRLPSRNFFRNFSQFFVSTAIRRRNVKFRFFFENRRWFTLSFRPGFEFWLHIRFCFEFRRWFAFSFRHYFDFFHIFDFTSNFEGDSPSHFVTISTLFTGSIMLRISKVIRLLISPHFRILLQNSFLVRTSKAIRLLISPLFRHFANRRFCFDMRSRYDGEMRSIFAISTKKIKCCCCRSGS